MKNELTVKEALEQGYEYYVYDSDGWQSLKDISDMDMNWDRDDIKLVNKEPNHPFGLDAKYIGETLAEIISVNYSDETGCDTDDVYDAVKDLDFSAVEKMINEALSKINHYRSSGIKLIP
jgi:hypothetical protein